MKIEAKEVSYTRRFNTGEYEFEEYSVSSIVGNDQTAEQVLIELKHQVNNAFVGVTVQTEKQETKKKVGRPKGSKNVSSKTNSSDDLDDSDGDSEEKVAGHDDESDHDDETTDGEDDNFGDDSGDSNGADEDDDESDDDNFAEEEEENESADGAGEVTIISKKGKTAKSEVGKNKKVYKKKPQAYNRSIEQHKELFSGILRSVSPDWKKSDKTKQLAKKTSEEMEGKNFIDENGEVLESFVSSVARLMKGKQK